MGFYARGVITSSKDVCKGFEGASSEYFTLYLHGTQEKEKEIILDSDEPLNCKSVA